MVVEWRKRDGLPTSIVQWDWRKEFALQVVKMSRVKKMHLDIILNSVISNESALATVSHEESGSSTWVEMKRNSSDHLDANMTPQEAIGNDMNIKFRSLKRGERDCCVIKISRCVVLSLFRAFHSSWMRSQEAVSFIRDCGNVISLRSKSWLKL